jgi:hypothetical protein
MKALSFKSKDFEKVIGIAFLLSLLAEDHITIIIILFNKNLKCEIILTGAAV